MLASLIFAAAFPGDIDGIFGLLLKFIIIAAVVWFIWWILNKFAAPDPVKWVVMGIVCLFVIWWALHVLLAVM